MLKKVYSGTQTWKMSKINASNWELRRTVTFSRFANLIKFWLSRSFPTYPGFSLVWTKVIFSISQKLIPLCTGIPTCPNPHFGRFDCTSVMRKAYYCYCVCPSLFICTSGGRKIVTTKPPHPGPNLAWSKIFRQKEKPKPTWVEFFHFYLLIWPVSPKCCLVPRSRMWPAPLCVCVCWSRERERERAEMRFHPFSSSSVNTILDSSSSSSINSSSSSNHSSSSSTLRRSGTHTQPSPSG